MAAEKKVCNKKRYCIITIMIFIFLNFHFKSAGMKKFLLLSVNFFAVIIVHTQTTPSTPPSINNYDSLLQGRKYPSQKFLWRDSLSNELRRKFFSNEIPPAGSVRKGLRYLRK